MSISIVGSAPTHQIQ